MQYKKTIMSFGMKLKYLRPEIEKSIKICGLNCGLKNLPMLELE